MVLSARVLARLLELQRKKAELEFRQNVLGQCRAPEREALGSEIKELEARVEAAGVKVAVPFANALDELSSSLSSFSAEDLSLAVRNKEGPAYEVLMRRGAIIKRNHHNRLEIAKLSLAIRALGGQEADALINAVRNGAIEKVELKRSQDRINRMICRFMRRCGLMCAYQEGMIVASLEQEEGESHIDLPNRRVYVQGSGRTELLDSLRRMDEIGTKIQIKNALRQVKEFSPEEENEFASMQQTYLEILREQDRILRSFDQEEEELERP